MDHLADLTGKTIGKYRIIKHLGRGGMAEVYQAYQTTLDRSVALKVILPYLNADTDFLRRFEREAKSVAALRHPNIVQVFDYDVEDGLPYMVMEYIEGDSLKMLLDKLGRRGQTLPLPQAVRVAREIAQALGYAHKQGVIHRDVKPGNVMLDKTGRVILMDFGVSKIVGVQTQTASGAATGTPAYMAPEQALGHAVDQRADLYALGVILYQLVTGHLPFEADSALTVMLKQAHDPRPSPRRLRPDLPEGLERVILKSMARDPNERFPAAEMFIDFLNNPGAAAELVVPPSSLLPGDPADRPAWLTEAGAEAGTAPPLTAPAAAESARLPAEQQNVARTVGRALKEITCYHCTGAGLELEPDGGVRCTFCAEVNAMAGPVCPRCETVNAAAAEVCAGCHLALARTCPACAARNWSGAERCRQCHRPLDTLSALMDRAGDAGERFHQERRELAAVSEQESAGARQRLEHLEAIDQRRHAALMAAQQRKAREQQFMLLAAAGLIIFIVAGLLAVAVFLR